MCRPHHPQDKPGPLAGGLQPLLPLQSSQQAGPSQSQTDDGIFIQVRHGETLLTGDRQSRCRIQSGCQPWLELDSSHAVKCNDRQDIYIYALNTLLTF